MSAQADEFTGAVTIYSQSFESPGSPDGWITIGGTSSAAPLWAGMTALINASSTCTSNATTANGVGFILPLLYAVASVPSDYAASFNDITQGNNDIYDISDGGTFPATTGYDMASGLGSPQLTAPDGGDGLAYYACSLGASATRPVISSLVPAFGPTATPTPVVITGSGFYANGSSNVAGLTVDGLSVPSGAFTVKSNTEIDASFPPSPLLTPPGEVGDGAGPANVVVTLKDGESSDLGAASVFQYVDEASPSNPVPAVSGVIDAAGNEAGGNTVTILGSGFASSGPTVTTGVTFGGIAAPFQVVSPYELTATVPPYSSSNTTCATAGQLPAGKNATNDVCQVQVVVSNANGSSTTYSIEPPYEGSIVYNPLGVIPAPAGEEAAPAPSEYDYLPTPFITSISTSGGPTTLASELGGSVITIQGGGFNPIGFEWLNYGPTASEGSLDTGVSYATGTTLQISAFGLGQLTVDSTTASVYVQSIAGASATADVTYAGIPNVDAVATPASAGGPLPAAPDTGGATVNLTGAGFSDVFAAQFVDVATPFSVGTDYDPGVVSDSAATLVNPAQNPAVVDVEMCTVTSCSYNPPSDVMVVYPPGNPVVSSSSPSTGPAQGGTPVTISGANMGCVVAVDFGTTAATNFGNGAGLLDCGTTDSIVAYAPPGVAGTTVPITVETVESMATGFGSTAPNPAAQFTYQTSAPSAPAPANATFGAGTITVTWHAPASNGGHPVTGYRVTASSPGRANLVWNASASATSYTFPYVQPGVVWTVSVAAVSSGGVGLPADAGQGTPTPGPNGYLVGTQNGAVLGFGSLSSDGGTGGVKLPSAVVGIASTPDGLGYWLATSGGTVYHFGNAPDLGSATVPAGTKIVGIASTRDGAGYWLVSNTGKVWTFGDAAAFGSPSNVNDIVGISPTGDDGGYWMAGANGAVYWFGDAENKGSMLGRPLNKPIVGIATYPGASEGYWLVGGDGGIFTFGAAKFRGSMQGLHLNQPASGMTPSPSGYGYWIVALDGGVFSFGDARFAGNPISAGAQSPSIGIAT